MNISYENYTEWKNWDFQFGNLSEIDFQYFNAQFPEFIKSGKSIIEVGFGSGNFLTWAAQVGCKVMGVEIQENLRKMATNSGIDARSSLSEFSSDYNEKIDVIVGLDVVEHMDFEEFSTLLNDAGRLLKPTARIMLRMPNGASPFSGIVQYGDATHKTFWTESKLKQLAKPLGFEVLSVANQARSYGPGGYMKRIGKMAQFLLRNLSNRTICAIYGLGTTALDPNMFAVLGKSIR